MFVQYSIIHRGYYSLRMEEILPRNVIKRGTKYFDVENASDYFLEIVSPSFVAGYSACTKGKRIHDTVSPLKVRPDPECSVIRSSLTLHKDQATRFNKLLTLGSIYRAYCRNQWNCNPSF